MDTVMEKNIAKLRKRFPEKYSDELAKEENRNRPEERKVLELAKLTEIYTKGKELESATHGWNACEELGHDWRPVISKDKFGDDSKSKCERCGLPEEHLKPQDKCEMTDPYYE